MKECEYLHCTCDCLGRAVLLCLVCLFDLHVACLLLSFISHLKTCTAALVAGRALCLEYKVSWVRVPPEAAHFF